MKAFLVIIAILSVVFILETSSNTGNNSFATARSTPRSDQVTLQAAPGNSVVQMFDSITSKNGRVIKTFPDGTRCTKITGPATAPLVVPPMRFFLVTCNSVSGYINAQWVR